MLCVVEPSAGNQGQTQVPKHGTLSGFLRQVSSQKGNG